MEGWTFRAISVLANSGIKLLQSQHSAQNGPFMHSNQIFLLHIASSVLDSSFIRSFRNCSQTRSKKKKLATNPHEFSFSRARSHKRAKDITDDFFPRGEEEEGNQCDGADFPGEGLWFHLREREREKCKTWVKEAKREKYLIPDSDRHLRHFTGTFYFSLSLPLSFLHRWVREREKNEKGLEKHFWLFLSERW